MAIYNQSNTSAPTPTNEEKKPQGSGFVNLGRILGANQNNRLGSAISSGITGSADNTRQNLSSTNSSFQQSANENNLASDTNKQARTQALQTIGSGTVPETPAGGYKMCLILELIN